jgi:hypothetical protein
VWRKCWYGNQSPHLLPIQTIVVMPITTTLPQSSDTAHQFSRFNPLNLFKRDYERYEGVPRINIYCLRILFALMFVFLSYDSWTHIFNHKGVWGVTDAVAWSVWGGYGMISWIGVLRPLKMLPLVLLEIVYKTIWLLVAAYPLWTNNTLAGSPAEYTANVFIFVAIPIVIMPWRYFFRTYILGKQPA